MDKVFGYKTGRTILSFDAERIGVIISLQVRLTKTKLFGGKV